MLYTNLTENGAISCDRGVHYLFLTISNVDACTMTNTDILTKNSLKYGTLYKYLFSHLFWSLWSNTHLVTFSH